MAAMILMGLLQALLSIFCCVCLYGCYHPLSVMPGVGMHTLFMRYFCTFVHGNTKCILIFAMSTCSQRNKK